MYTTDMSEEPTYVYEDIQGYCVPNMGECGATLPLYRVYSATGIGKWDNCIKQPCQRIIADHLYTTSAAEKAATLGGGFVDQGVQCYVWPTNTPIGKGKFTFVK